MDEPLLVTRILIFVLINQLLTEHFTDGDIIATVQWGRRQNVGDKEYEPSR